MKDPNTYSHTTIPGTGALKEVPRYVSVKTAAMLLEVNADTIRRQITAGLIDTIHIGRIVRIPISELTPQALSKKTLH